MRLHRIPEGNYWVYLLSKIRRQNLCCQEWILSREGVSLERSDWKESRTRRGYRTSLGFESSAAPEDVPVPPALMREEANDNDHETLNKVTTKSRRSTRTRT